MTQNWKGLSRLRALQKALNVRCHICKTPHHDCLIFRQERDAYPKLTPSYLASIEDYGFCLTAAEKALPLCLNCNAGVNSGRIILDGLQLAPEGD